MFSALFQIRRDETVARLWYEECTIELKRNKFVARYATIRDKITEWKKFRGMIHRNRVTVYSGAHTNVTVLLRTPQLRYC